MSVIEKVFCMPFALAVTTAVCWLETAKADAMKTALVEPEAIVTLAGTVRLELLLESVTGNPPWGAAPFKVAVQVEDPAPVIVDGAHESVLSPSCCWMVIVPP